MSDEILNVGSVPVEVSTVESAPESVEEGKVIDATVVEEVKTDVVAEPTPDTEVK